MQSEAGRHAPPTHAACTGTGCALTHAPRHPGLDHGAFSSASFVTQLLSLVICVARRCKAAPRLRSACLHGGHAKAGLLHTLRDATFPAGCGPGINVTARSCIDGDPAEAVFSIESACGGKRVAHKSVLVGACTCP